MLERGSSTIGLEKSLDASSTEASSKYKYFYTPIDLTSYFSCSYDTRVSGPSAHWIEDPYIGRAHWQNVPTASLHLYDVQARDRAIYRCRVDFHVSPTRNYKIALDVVGKLYMNIKNKNEYIL